MVYRGKPSKGCDLCRKRKIRCDESRPQCGQCVKHRAICPGYRDLDDLNFVDENYHTREVASRKDKSRVTIVRLGRSAASSPSPALEDDQQRSLTLRKPSLSVEDCALTYFYNNFIMPTYLGFMPSRDELTDTSTAVGAALQCAALAGFANRLGSLVDIQLARRQYARALLLANAALRNPKRAGTPDTLVAIHFLSIFENIDCDKQDRLVAWQTHVKGNLALIRQMDQEKLTHPNCLPVFNHMRMLVLTSCMWTQTAVPSHFIDALDYAHEKVNNKVPFERLAHKLFKIGIEYIDLRAAVRSNDMTDCSQIISRCHDLDRRLSAWHDEATNHDPYWDFERIYDQFASPTEVWKAMYDIYPTYPTSMKWYFYRCIRGLLTMMLDYFLRKAYRGSMIEEHLRLARLRSELLDDICAGVPARLGYGRDGLNLACGGFGIVFPLFYVGELIIAMIRRKTDFCDVLMEAATSDEEKSQAAANVVQSRRSRVAQLYWVIGRLEYVAQGLGIFQARVFARLLQKQWELVCAEQTDLCMPKSEDPLYPITPTCMEEMGNLSHPPSPDAETTSNVWLASTLSSFTGNKRKQESWSTVFSRRSTPLPDSMT